MASTAPTSHLSRTPRGPVGRPVARTSGPVRLTRRGRAVLGGVVLAGGLGLATVVGSVVTTGGPAEPGIVLAGESSVVVRPGDTLWSIAESLAPSSDPRAVVDALQERNGLEGADLVPGQVLVVP